MSGDRAESMASRLVATAIPAGEESSAPQSPPLTELQAAIILRDRHQARADKHWRRSIAHSAQRVYFASTDPWWAEECKRIAEANIAAGDWEERMVREFDHIIADLLRKAA
jgi:hypothetical protein